MMLSINQPAYLPWPGYYDRIAASDLHVVLDDVQFEKNSLTNRNKVRTPAGWTWLTVPVRLKGHTTGTISEIAIAPQEKWARSHWRTLEANYRRAPHFATHQKPLQAIYGTHWSRLYPLIEALDDYLRQALEIRTEIVRSSTIETGGEKADRILALCEHFGADTYLSGPFGREYLDERRFRKHGVAIVYHDYAPPRYTQAFPGFEPAMSVLDLLFNCGSESTGVMSRGRPVSLHAGEAHLTPE